MLKYILFIGTLLALPSSNYAMTGEEAYNIAQGLGKKVQASHDHIQQLGLKGDSMIKAWQDLRELSGKSKASLDTGERARLTSAEKVLKPFFKENGKNGNNFFTLQKEIDQEIAQLDQYRREAKEARAYMESHPEEMKKYSNSEQQKSEFKTTEMISPMRKWKPLKPQPIWIALNPNMLKRKFQHTWQINWLNL